MFTTFAETYMTATRVETFLGQRGAEAERLALLRARRQAEKEWIAERMKEAGAAHRRARLKQALRWTGARLVAAGEALARIGRDETAGREARCC